jgi:hypothetical protein
VTWFRSTSRSWTHPSRCGHRVHSRRSGTPRGRGIGYDYLHAAVDDHSRLAYVELLDDERDQSCAGFWRRAQGFFANHGITVRRVLTDNGPGYRSRTFAAALAEHQIAHKWTRPYRPRPTARSSGSTGPCRKRGPTGGCPGHRPPQHTPCQPGPSLQPSPCPHRTRRPSTNQPCQQPPGSLQLDHTAPRTEARCGCAAAIVSSRAEEPMAATSIRRIRSWRRPRRGSPW